MIVLLPTPYDISIILKRQKGDLDPTLREIAFCVQVDVPQGRLMYHTLTKELILLEAGDEADPEVRRFLFEHWYLVPLHHNDRQLADELQSIAQVLVQKKQRGRITSFTVLPTTDCNARCFYCYERGIKHAHMSDEIAADTARYIAASSGGERVNLHWFGGEPLYNERAIDLICQELERRGVPYRSDMISNAFLFDLEMIRKAVGLWKLRQVQITLDGMEEVYNRRKAYINPGCNPFQRVMGNIRLLLEMGVRVCIRLNLDRQNEADLYRLCGELSEQFGRDPKLRVYPSLLFTQGQPMAEEADMCRCLEALEEFIAQSGMLHTSLLDQAVKTHQCMADNDASVVILPNGDLHACDGLQPGRAWGNINNPATCQETRAYFRKRLPPLPECDTCAHYPNCIRLACCPMGGGACTPMILWKHERKLRRSILAWWQTYLEKEAKREA